MQEGSRIDSTSQKSPPNSSSLASALFDFVTDGNRLLDAGTRPGPSVLAAWAAVDAILDVCPSPRADDAALRTWVEERIAARTTARRARDFTAADRIRAELKARGVEIEDTPGGTTWRVA
jgi:cysteinyl-tRNA synthetase